MKIQLKRSNVLESGNAKVPTSAQLDYGELAINYNADDPTLFLKDSNDNVIKFGGTSAYDDRYVQRAGDNMTGSLTFGTDGATTPNITLDSTGSATFAGNVQVAGFPEDGAADGAVIRSSGAIQASRAAGSTLWAGYTTGTTGFTSQIKADGSATFAGGETVIYSSGSLEIGGNPVTSGTTAIQLANTGSIKARSSIPTSISVYGQTGNDPTIELNRDGSATFAADVNVGNRNPGSSSSAGTRIANESGVSGVYTQSNSSVNQSSLAFQALRGTDEIFKVSYDGSAEFAGAINGNSYYGYYDGDTSNSSSMRFNARARDVGGDFQLYDASGTSNRTIYLDGSDGSATFAAEVGVANRIYTTGENAKFEVSSALNGSSTDVGLDIQDLSGRKAAIFLDGSAEFAGGATEISSSGAIAVNRAAGTNDIFTGQLNGSVTLNIEADGSATFGPFDLSSNNGWGAQIKTQGNAAILLLSA